MGCSLHVTSLQYARIELFLSYCMLLCYRKKAMAHSDDTHPFKRLTKDISQYAQIFISCMGT